MRPRQNRKRVTVDEDGLTVDYGDPNPPNVVPWSELQDAAITVALFPPADMRWVELDIETTYGISVMVTVDDDGFHQAVQAFAHRGGNPTPDLDLLPHGVFMLWQSAPQP